MRLNVDAIKIERECSVKCEIAKIAKQNENKTLLFENIRESGISLLTNYFIPKNVEKFFPKEYLIRTFGKKGKLKVINEFPFAEISLKDLPILTFWHNTKPYITSGIVIAEDEEFGVNASFHRLMVINEKKLAIRITERDLYKYYQKAQERNKALNIAIIITLNPCILLAAATSLRINENELEYAAALQNKPLELIKLENGVSVPADSEIIIEGYIPPKERVPEGPFVDITGTWDIVREQPVVYVDKVYCKENAIYYTIVPSSLEHKCLMGMPKEIEIFNALKDAGIDVRDVYLTEGGCKWLHCVIAIRKHEKDDAKAAAEVALKTHRSIKHIVIVDDDINVRDMQDVEWAIATRVQADKDIILLKNQIGSSLDPSATHGKTCKVIIDATIKGQEENFRRVF